jgi:DNA-binding MarR family transcriptional regulator
MGMIVDGDEVSMPHERQTLGLDWIPYRCSVISNRVSACLQSMYGERFQLSVPGWRLMFVLGRDAPLSAKEVGERTAMDQVQVTRAITQMASVGLVSRRVDPADRRRVILRLSRKGMEAYGEIAPLAKRIEQQIIAPLTPAETTEFGRLLDKVFHRAEDILPDGVDWRSFMADADANFEAHPAQVAEKRA